MKPKAQLFILAIAMIRAAAGLISCEGPIAPEFTNPYDEQSDNYIPTSDINTRPISGIRALEAVSAVL